MICKNCGKELHDTTLLSCPYCNNSLQNLDFSSADVVNTSVVDNSPLPIEEKKVEKEFDYNIVIMLVIFIILGGAGFIFVQAINGNLFYFSTNEIVEESNQAINEVLDTTTEKEYQAVSKSGQDGTATGTGVTSVIFDNQYLEQTILKSKEEVMKFIALDSGNNRRNCSQEILDIEKNIETNYGIPSVNLCEMDVTFARELESVAAFIYNNYPSARGRITNITLANVEEGASYMAAFMPIFTFVTSNTSSLYPLGIKTQIILNAKYFLNNKKIESSASYGAKSGYFPKGATRSSTVAHEFGHYLSYVAMMNHYKTDNLTFVRPNNGAVMMSVYEDFDVGSFSNKLVKNAYNKYLNNYGGNLSYDDFRASISKYAIAKDGTGAYIYDETIAEAFHDYYLNGDNAVLASKLIMEELMTYL